MEWNGLFGLFYGLLGGFFEFLPVSPQVHQAVMLKLCGLNTPGYGMALAVHIGALAAVVLSYYSRISKLHREQKIFTQPKRRRRRQPDIISLMELRLLKITAVPVTMSCLIMPWLSRYFDRLWVLVLLAVFNGILILLPHYMARANKDARSLSPLDATLMGAGGALGALPGISRVGVLTAVGSMRGADRQFGLDFVYLLSIPALAALCIGDLAMIVTAGDPQAGVLFFPGVLACITAFGAGMAGIQFMRFLAVKNGFESLAYYNWGLAMFAFIIYLIG